MLSMSFIVIMVIVIAVVLAIVSLISKKDVEDDTEIKVKENEVLPYKIKDNFLSNAELNFYRTLKAYIGDKALICPKVGLKDIFFINNAGKNYMKYFGRIAKKHTDFILCEPETMKLLCGIELDDSSHQNKKTQNRDSFVEKVYETAGLLLIRFKASNSYSMGELELKLSLVLNKLKFNQKEIVPLDTIMSEESKISSHKEMTNNDDSTVPNCPKCGIPMVVRKAVRGSNAGKTFYGCTNYPQCKEVLE